MGKLQEFLLENLPNCQFKIDDYNKKMRIEINNLLMFRTNFAGEPDNFNNTARQFNVAISDEIEKVLSESDKTIRIHHLGMKKNKKTGLEEPIINEQTGEPEIVIPYINVKVKMGGQFPPIVKLFTEYRGDRSCTDLNEDTIACLDHAHIITADCIINVTESNRNPGHYVCYLQRLYAIQEKRVEFDGKYDDWLSGGTEDEDGDPESSDN